MNECTVTNYFCHQLFSHQLFTGYGFLALRIRQFFFLKEVTQSQMDFSPKYREGLDLVNPDQGHHFSAFFELGYSAARLAGSWGYDGERTGTAVGWAAAIQHDICL